MIFPPLPPTPSRHTRGSPRHDRAADSLSPTLFLTTVTPDGSLHPQRSKPLRKTHFARDKDGGQETLTSENLAASRHPRARENLNGGELCSLGDGRVSLGNRRRDARGSGSAEGYMKQAAVLWT
ncbi:hypothetical protein VULLAG_LOCUS1900 [Vulpes lagopus]